jgi:uncharacterized surface protein with fasciclin (FAS1) repeats
MDFDMSDRLKLLAAAAIAAPLFLAACANDMGRDDASMASDRSASSAMSAPAQPMAETSPAPMSQQGGMSAQTPMPMGDVVAVASANPEFSTLVTAIQAAGLVDTLKGAGPFTVFAPTNAAFAALPAGALDDLLKPENKARLTAVLTYHVLPGKVIAADVTGAQVSPASVQGATLAVDGRAGVSVNGANVVTPDIQASNGVIHVIDKVLMPPAR